MLALQKGDLFTSLSAVTAAVKGAAVALFSRDKGVDQKRYSWSVNIAGGPPATIQVDLEGNIEDPTDDTKWFSLDTTSATTPTQLRHVVNKDVKWLRVELVSIGAGGGSVTAKIWEG